MAATTETAVTKRAVRFPSGETECAALLYVPQGADAAQPRAALVLGHGLGAVKEMQLDGTAERFAGAGYVTLVFDYRYFGESGGEPRQLLDPARQIEDWFAALRYVRALPEVDPARVAIFGTSFGGGHAISVAARDGGVAAAIAQCPFTDGLASAMTIDPRGTVGVATRTVGDLVAAWRGDPPVFVNLAGAPGEPALMNAPDVVDGYGALQPEGLPIRGEVPARVALRLPMLRPGREARNVNCPILFSICDNDSVAPAKTALKWAAKAPKGEVNRYPIGHFDIYLGEHFERAHADQLAFLQRHVPPLGA